ncbi:SDR family NAD(P)-dependent oxidoreductase [Patescibacteria group bacterium]|nr:SDR family NAD(P)-dependent oxidoreductase [Patescibacteria group bacterium]MCG2687640.1 SDR family NAD(P)-dependent oxidoreductase [Candidatus Parcubacteria bacterium]
MQKQKTVIITGGSGFIGSHLADALIEQGHKVVVIDKVKPEKNRHNDHVKYIKINIQDEDVKDLFKKYKPDVVFHLAAHLHDRESVEKPVVNAMDNVIGLINVCEGVRESGQAKIIFTSSCAVYGPQDVLPIDEQVNPVPLTPYGISKLTGEKYLHFYNKTYNIPYVAFRPGNIYGPRQDSSAESGVVGIFSSRLLKGKTAIINNNGKTTRDYVYVADVVTALIKASELDYVGILNLGTGIQTTTMEIFDYVKDAVGTRASHDWNEAQQDATKYMELSIKKIKKELDWEPNTSLNEGIKKTVAWYRENI